MSTEATRIKPVTSVPVTKPAAPTVEHLEGRSQKPAMTYEQMWEQMNPYRPMSDDDIKKELRREKREKLFAAIGDGLTALSGAWYNKGGVRYDPAASLSESTRKRWDEIRERRKAQELAYKEGLLKAHAMDEDQAQKAEEWREKLEQMKISNALAWKKEEREAALAESQIMLRNAEIDLKTYQALKASIEAGNYDAYMKARTALLQQQAKTQETQQENNRASAALSGARKAQIEQGTTTEVTETETENPDTGEKTKTRTSTTKGVDPWAAYVVK